MDLTTKQLNEIRECLELLRSIESIDYHNGNWLPDWAIKSPKKLSEGKIKLINRAISIVGQTSDQAIF